MRLTWALAVAALAQGQLFDRNTPELHSDIVEHFKYGSIGAEDRAGIPLWIWRVLPDLFPQYLPQRPGNGYERFGLIVVNPVGWVNSAGSAIPLASVAAVVTLIL